MHAPLSPPHMSLPFLCFIEILIVVMPLRLVTDSLPNIHEKKLTSPVLFIECTCLVSQLVIRLSTRVYSRSLVPRVLELVYQLVNSMPSVLGLLCTSPPTF
uniref:Uncharacterized protein n=1 Tax=Arundo donax TaxID=35708 RepID=A0A0A9DSI4_ARUDO